MKFLSCTFLSFLLFIVTTYANNWKYYDNVLSETTTLNYGQLNINDLALDSLISSTYLGGNSTDDDYEPAIAIDKNGNVFISGYTFSSDFPTTEGAYSTSKNGATDRFISKFNSNLSQLLASTYIGGNSYEYGMGLAIDNDNNVVITGYTYSEDYPTTNGSYDETFNGSSDVYITKLNNNLTDIISSSFLGGDDNEGKTWPRIDITIGQNGDIYLAGLTKSSNFPTSNNAFSKNLSGGQFGGDIFIAKLKSDLTELLASTYLGSDGDEWRPSIILDPEENIYICGETESSSFPTTAGAYDETINSGYDIFITKLSNDLSTILASTVLGGRYEEEALCMRYFNNEIFLAGYTFSGNFPTTAGSYHPDIFGGVRDAYICKMNSDLSTLIASTFFGGDNEDICRDLIIDNNGNIFITGNTRSSDFYTTSESYDQEFNGGFPHGDAFIAKLSNDLSTVDIATFFGGTSDDVGYTLKYDLDGNIYICGTTSSSDLPTSNNAYNTSYNGGANDLFISKFNKKLSNSTGLKDKNIINGSNNIFPNPFFDEVTISFYNNSKNDVDINIYDINGCIVKHLIQKGLSIGMHNINWNGKGNNGNYLKPGIYICEIRSGKNEICSYVILKNNSL
jgi:Secretion system C-terminal sorting domain/Beta-propeller repeat